MSQEKSLSPATRVVAAGRPAREQGNPVNAPIVLSSTYVSAGVPAPGEKLYARYTTETWEPFEAALADLEEAELPALLFSSGMGAITAVLSLVTPGSAVVVPRHAYHAALQAAHHLTETAGVEVREVDVTDTAAVVGAIAPPGAERASVVWLESPTNPMLEIADVPAIAAEARGRGALTIVDNTFATPLGQRPLTMGADVVVHSVTKYLAGHSDVVLGAAVTSDPALRERIQARRTVGGAIAGPFEAYLALRGLRTLALRVERSQANAFELARRLEDHPAVRGVSYPGLESHPQHALAAKLLDGYGSVLTLRPRGGAAAADAVTRSVRVWVPGTSLGGVESLIERRRRFATEAPTVPEDLLRVSVGIEDVEDLWSDLDQALRAH